MLLDVHAMNQTPEELEKCRGTVGLLIAHPLPHLRNSSPFLMLQRGRKSKTINGIGHAVNLLCPVDVRDLLCLSGLVYQCVELLNG
ncbi:hypothetical protein [Streptomyces antimycoticus]|uniref:hypothetical protein n=1 Tax=Streptomyces antimycoticus TaxID=68175 RepID=UPI00118024A9|nr:hypothetical protein [Streptomyces antimycoticus]